MKYFAAAALTAILTAGAASAATTSAQTANWTAAPDPIAGYQTGSFSASSDEVLMGSNGYRSHVSDVTTSGDFTYTGTMRATTDDDIMGVVFGYQDPSNTFYLSWNGGGVGTNSGLRLVREESGVANVLYSVPSNTWTGRTDYDFSITVAAGNISFSITEGSNTIASATVAAGGSTDGKLGVFVYSNYTNFTDLAYDLTPGTTAVPLPAGAPLLIAGIGAFAALRRRKKAA